MKQLKSTLLVFLCVGLLAGCSAQHGYNYEYRVEDNIHLQTIDDAKNSSVTGIGFERTTLLNDGRIKIPVTQTYFREKYKDTLRVKYEQPYSTVSWDVLLNPFTTPLNPLALLILSDSWMYEDLFGSTGKWRKVSEYSNRYRKPELISREVLNREEETGRYGRDKYNFTTWVQAKSDSQSEWVSHENSYRDGFIYVDVKEALAGATFEPDRARVEFSMYLNKGTADEESYSDYTTIPSSMITKMGLKNESWRPDQDRYQDYMADMRRCMRDQDYSCAARQFELIEAMNQSVPDSFYFHYARVLKASGKHNQAKDKARSYLRLTEDKTFVDQARNIVGEVQ